MAKAFGRLREPWPAEACMWSVDFVEYLPALHSTHRTFVQTVPPWQGEHVLQVHMFIDGSSYQNRDERSVAPAAWAFIAILQCQVSDNEFCYRFFCAASQMIATALGAPTMVPHVGELLTDALTSEAVGMTWALAWLAQAPFACDACLYYDNTTVGGFAGGSSFWNATWEFQKLKSNIGALRHYLLSIGCSFVCCHLKSHDDHPWSEAVDALAKATAQKILVPGSLPDCVTHALHSAHIEHAWTTVSDAQVLPPPSTWRSSFQAEGPFHGHNPDTTWVHDEHVSLDESVTFTFTLATANAQDPATSWLGMVCQDLQYLQHLVPFDTVKNLARYEHVEELARFSAHNPTALNRYVAKAGVIYEKYVRIWTIFRAFQSAFRADMTRYAVDSYKQTEPSHLPGGYACGECDATFDSFGALCTHVYKRHQKGSMAQRYAVGNTCRACLKCYRGRQQLIHHLKYFRTKCILKLILSVPPLNDEELQMIHDQEAEERKALRSRQRASQHKLPAMQAAGPVRPWPWQRATPSEMSVSDNSVTSADPSWVLEIFSSLEDNCVLTTLNILQRYAYHASLRNHIVSFFASTYDTTLHVDMAAAQQHLVLQEALVLWQDNNLQVPEYRNYPISMRTAANQLLQLRIPNHVAQEHVPSMQERRHTAMEKFWKDAHVPTQIAHELQDEHDTAWRWPFLAPRTLVRKPTFLYIFSGRRRKDDFQQFVEQFLQEQGELGQVLLIDLALSKLHDVTTNDLMEMFLGWFSCGFIAALLIAPPCETWSQARHQETDFGKSPRPLRSAQYPFGLDGLTQAELDQVYVSSLLLFVSLRLFFAAIIHSVPATMEHPAAPSKKDRASIWFLPWITHFLEHHNVHLLSIDQAAYGAVSLKPTHLLMCCLPHCKVAFHKHKRSFQWKDLKTLSGRDASGKWRTSYAKEYPGPLNAAIAQAHVDELARQRRSATFVPLDPLQQHHFETLDVGGLDYRDQEMQPDYARNVGIDLTGLD
eukprot:Skav215897  [mRNA]  locus=scaffold1542:1959:8127:- [translate_table: standard]